MLICGILSLLWVIPHPHERGVLTGKIFDYLAAGRPIVAVPCDNGEIKRLLNETQAGYSLSREEDIVEKYVSFLSYGKKTKSLQ